MKQNFVHLHVHSHYSLLDGLPKIPDLVKRAKELGMEALALTDHGVLYGAVEFYKAAKKAGIKPIIGQELYLTPGSRHDKRPKIDDIRYHLTVLAKNETGYKNLVQLTTKAHLEGFYYKPRVDKELLRTHNEGLIALSGCMNGELARAVRSGNLKKAELVAREYQAIFGPENYFIEIWHHPGVAGSNETKEKLIALAQGLNIPLVATHDVHYLRPEDKEAQDILMAVSTGSNLTEDDRLSLKADDFSLAAPQKMAEYFRETPEALENTNRIAELCSFEFSLGQMQLPHFKVPNGKSPNEYLREIAYAGLGERYGDPPAGGPDPQVEERLNYELAVIEKTGFAEYFLIVHDFVSWAKHQGIVVGPGRGSAAGSIVSYLLGITALDPLKYELLFERFLNPDRISMPDIDLDFADTRRDEVINYVKKKYGEDHVAQIITFGTMASRAAVRDTGRALGLPYSFCDTIAKLVPFNLSLDKSLERVTELRQLYDTDPQARQLLNAARKLEGVARHASTHACGVVITKEPLTSIIPLQRATRGDETIVTQYEMRAVEDLGLLKMDFLGLKNLTIIEETINDVARSHGVKIDLDTLPLDDKETFELLCHGETTGVFQLESGGMKRYLKELEPTEFEDIVSMVTLYRPGPLETGMAKEFIERKHGRRQISYLHPELESILKKTYGIMIYQEQLMEVARMLAGFTLAEADVLRKAVGKKIRSLLEEQRAKLIEGMIVNNLAPRTAERIWELIEPFARYGFNRSHAACYAMLALETAYLKAHWPTEFMKALLNADSSDVERIAFLIQEAKDMGLTILPPEVNESGVGFAVSAPTTIRFGLAAIKNVGSAITEAVVGERNRNGEFGSIEDFLSRIDVKDLNKKSLESLVKAGVFDNLGERSQLAANLDNLLEFSRESRRARSAGQESIFELAGGRPQAIRLRQVPPASANQRLGWEKELLGLYVSDHPLSMVKEKLAKVASPITALKPSQRNVTVGGILTKLKKILTKNGQPMVFAELTDLTGKIEVVVFPSALEKNAAVWQEEKMVLVRGQVQERDKALKLICNDVQLL